MNCKSCNTRMPAGLRTCPNCGRLSTNPASASRDEDSRYPLNRSAERGEAEPGRAERDPVDLEFEEIEELEDVVDNDETVVADPSASARNSPRARREARPQSTRVRPSSPRPAPAAQRRAAPSGGAAVAGVGPSLDEIRRLVSNQPELLEAGLRLHAVDGHAAGEPFRTDVGDVDLLAIDDAGGMVAIMIVSNTDSVTKQIVGETLQRVGWLSRHAAEDGQEVRAIVVVDSLPEEVEYAAAAVGDAIEFKTWRVSVRFDPLEF